MNFFKFLILSIFFIKIQYICAITPSEIIRSKRISFSNEARSIIDQSNLEDQNEKIIDDSLRTYKYFMVKDLNEIKAVFVFDDLNINKAKELGVHYEKNKVHILNIQDRIHNIYPLDEIVTFSETIYRERKIFSFKTNYSTTNYILTKFVFNINIQNEDEEEVMSLLLNDELLMKNKSLEILKKDDNSEGNKNMERNHYSSNNFLKEYPHSFTQFIGAILNISSIVSSISGTISAISSLFSSSPAPLPPTFLSQSKAKLATFHKKIDRNVNMVNKKDEDYKYGDDDDDDNDDDDDYNDDDDDDDDYNDDDDDVDNDDYDYDYDDEYEED